MPCEHSVRRCRAALFGLDLVRIGRRHRQRAGSWGRALGYAAHCRLIAIPQLWGLVQWLRRGGLRPRPAAEQVPGPAAGATP